MVQKTQKTTEKAKIFNILSIVFALLTVATIVGTLVSVLIAPATVAAGDLMMIYLPIYILLGAITVVFRRKSKKLTSSVTPTTEWTPAEKRRRKIMTTIFLTILGAVFVIPIIVRIILNIYHSINK